jgi:tripeptidyl-peptidase-1
VIPESRVSTPNLHFPSPSKKKQDYPPAFGGTDGPTGCLGPKGNIFNPTWPGTCPFVTSVGATKLYPGSTVNDPESAVLDPAYPPYSSGGGFSNIYPIPDYQSKAVANYFDKYSPPYPYYSALSPDSSEVPDIAAIVGDSDGIYNRIGRGIPDVSANGDNDAVCFLCALLLESSLINR